MGREVGNVWEGEEERRTHGHYRQPPYAHSPVMKEDHRPVSTQSALTLTATEARCIVDLRCCQEPLPLISPSDGPREPCAWCRPVGILFLRV